MRALCLKKTVAYRYAYDAYVMLKRCIFTWRGIRAFVRKDAAYWDRGAYLCGLGLWGLVRIMGYMWCWQDRKD